MEQNVFSSSRVACAAGTARDYHDLTQNSYTVLHAAE
jgi:hypothetical protein